MTDEELNQRFGQLVDAQLRFQQQLGDMAGIVRDLAENQRQITQRQERQERILQRLQEIRFLIRCQHPPLDDQTDLPPE